MVRRPVVHLVDASIYIFRAWFAMPEQIRNPRGEPVNAVYGFAHFLCDLLEREPISHMAVAFDRSLTTSFRNKLYPDYKANRELPPAELERQFRWCEHLTRALGLTTLASRRYEADDLIGTAAARMRDSHFRAVIVSGDKDLGQCLQAGDQLWDFSRDRRESPRALKQRLGIHARQIPDWLALAGDAADNIPGVPGIGIKTATRLLQHFTDLDDLYRRLHRVEKMPLRGTSGIQSRLRDHREQALLCRKLARITENAPLRVDAGRLLRKPPSGARLNRLFGELGFGERIRKRIAALNKPLA